MIKLSHKGKAVEKQTKIAMLTQTDEKDLTKKILTTRGRTANFGKFWLLALQKGRKKGIISNSTKGEMEA
jgi:hypothetical protein